MGRVKKQIEQELPTSEDFFNVSEMDNTEKKRTRRKTDEIITYKAIDNIILRKGRNVIDTGIPADDNTQYIVTETEDVAEHGLIVENQMRLMNSSVIPMIYGKGTVKIIINVNDEVLVTEQTGLGVKTRNCCITKGTKIAQIKNIS